jgi:two-component system, LytTR family, sensor kinase
MDTTTVISSRPRPPATPELPHARVIILSGLAGAIVLSGAISTQTYLSMLGHGHSYRSTLAWQLSIWSLWALAAPLVLRKGGQLAVERDPARDISKQAALLGIGLITAHLAFAAWMALLFQPYEPNIESGFVEAFARQFSVLPVDLLVYGAMVLIGWTLTVSRAARRLEVRESRLEAELARAQLDALRLEIQPHFLFNTLNAIGALVRLQATDRALEMLVGLSELMRSTLDRTGEQLCTLEAELDFTKRYVDLQLARFGERLLVDYRVEPSTLELQVPTFALQPLVENALRHGLGVQSRRCRLEIGTSIEQATLHVWVRDDGVGLPPGFDITRDAGTGLANIRSRLERLHGAEGRLELHSMPGGGTEARLVVPALAVSAEIVGEGSARDAADAKAAIA